MLNYCQQPPPAELAPWVECTWTLEGVADAETETILPDGRMELVDIGQMLQPGKLFGEIAFFSPSRRRTRTARCVDDCTVLMIDETTVKELYFQNPSFGFHLIGLVAGRLSSDVERLEKQLAEKSSQAPPP